MELIYTSRPELKSKLQIAYCPERVLPGNVMYELVHNDRVIGGIDEASTEKAVAFLDNIQKEIYTGPMQEQQKCVIVENSSRDVQIAFANELSLICDKADINVWELIALANKHPRVNILSPGCGVGGHCKRLILILLFQISNESKIIGTARETNNYKSFWCAEKIQNAKLEFQIKHGRNQAWH